MDVTALLRKERRIWHEHFIPGVVAGIIVALITAFFTMTGSNIALFGSIGSSAVILTHKYRHHLTMLRTVLLSYILATATSVAILHFNVPMWAKSFLAVAGVTMVLYSVNTFHPPAVSAGLAVVLYDRPLVELVYVLAATIVVFVIIRYLLYVVHDHLSVEEFVQEFW